MQPSHPKTRDPGEPRARALFRHPTLNDGEQYPPRRGHDQSTPPEELCCASRRARLRARRAARSSALPSPPLAGAGAGVLVTGADAFGFSGILMGVTATSGLSSCATGIW